MNVMTLAAAEQNLFEKFHAENTGYEVFTTFASDITIAECFGETALRKNCKEIFESWKHDIKYITEFVMALNFKLWAYYDRSQATDNEKARTTYDTLARIYDDLWRKYDEKVYNYYGADGINDEEGLNYYIQTTD